MKAAMFVLVTGLILTLGGVGGIEHNEDWISAAIVTATGLSIMWAGTVMVRRHTMEYEEYSPYNTNNS